MAEKQRMINNFVSLARSDKSDRTPSSRGSTPTNQLPNHHSDQLDIEKMKRDNELSKQRLESLRREVKERFFFIEMTDFGSISIAKYYFLIYTA